MTGSARPSSQGVLPPRSAGDGLFARLKRTLVGWRSRRLPGASDAPSVAITGERVQAQGFTRVKSAPLHAQPEVAELAIDGALDVLGRALDTRDASRRAAALEVVCGFAQDNSVGLLQPMLYDPDVAVRRTAAQLAARLRSRALLPSLIVALEDPDPEVRRAAARAIEEITHREVPSEPDRDASYGACARELKRWWKEQRLRELGDGVSDSAPAIEQHRIFSDLSGSR